MEVDERTAPSGGAAAAASPRRRLLIAAGAVALVVIAVLVWVLTTGGAGTAAPATDRSPAATPSPAVDETSAPAPPAPAPAAAPAPAPDLDEPPAPLPAVPFDGTAAVGNGIEATIASIEAIDGTAVGPGNIAGPALRLTVRIENGTGQDVSLDGVAVNASYGVDGTPASPLDDPSRAPFSGTVSPGAAEEGIYVFRVPPEARDLVTVEVGYQAGAPLLVFTGAAA